MIQVQGTLTGDNYVTEITGLPFTPKVVDVDSAGRIFVGDIASDIWQSLDQGITWTKVLDMPSTPYHVQLLLVDSRDYIVAQVWNASASQWDLVRSVDNGASWGVVASNVKRMGLGNWGESSNGTLYASTWGEAGGGYRDAVIYSSVDYGATWSVWYNITGTVTHTHAVNVAPNDWVYISTGDAYGGDYSNQSIRRWNLTDWEIVVNGSLANPSVQPTSIWFDDTYAYFGSDFAPTILFRMPYDGEWDQAEIVMSQYMAGSSNWAFEGVSIGDIMLFGTERGQLWGSWDGERWVLIWASPTNSVYSISKRSPIYFVERTNGELYRLNIQKEDLIKVYYQQYNSKRGTLINAENYVLEQRISNGTNYVDLTDVALSNVQASIKGLSRINYAPTDNSGFELGDFTDWAVAGQSGAVSITSNASEVANGTYASKIEKSSLHAFANTITTESFTVQRGEIIVVSGYFKGNDTVSDALTIGVYNATNYPFTYPYFNVTPSWTRHTMSYALYQSPIHDAPNNLMHIKFNFGKHNLTTYFDSVTVQVLEVGMEYFESTTVDSTLYTEGRTPFTYFDETLNTTNPTLTINSETVSHSGELTNGTESSTQSLTGILTGAVRVDANISGSEQAILRITGTRITSIDNSTIQGRTDNVYYGRYYATPAINATDLVVLANKEANITTLSYANSRLTFSVNAPSNTTSTTKVYWPYTFAPRKVECTASTYNWTHNLTTNITTLSANHSSSVDWTLYVQLPDGESCSSNDECGNGYCVHSICRSSLTYCGDGYCDAGENCFSCVSDCGTCVSEGFPQTPPPTSSTTLGKVVIYIPSIPADSKTNITIQKTEGVDFTEIEITAANNIRSVYLTIRRLDAKPAEVPALINVYHYINVIPNNIEDEDISEAKIKFKVEKSWISINDIDEDTVALQRYANDKWNKLTTAKLSEDSDYVYYEAEVPGFSYFAITGEETAPECPICPSPSAWSECIEGEQTRTNYRCNEETDYECQSYSEEQTCETPPVTPKIPKELIVGIAVSMIIAAVVIFLIRKVKK